MKAEKGEALGAFLTRVVEGMDDDRADIISRISSAAGIGEDTVNQILSGTIECPPTNRLRGFARVLGISMDSILDAGNRDGCEYEKSKGDELFDKGTEFLKKDHAAMDDDDDEEDDKEGDDEEDEENKQGDDEDEEENEEDEEEDKD